MRLCGDPPLVSVQGMTEAAAPTTGPLAPDDVARFHERGVLRVPEAFPREVALGIRDTLCRDLERRLGVRADDRETWQRAPYWTGFRDGVKSAAGRVPSPRLAAALDQLLGAGRWSYPRRWGGLLVGPPEPAGTPWTLTDRSWHWDGQPLVGASMFCLYTDLPPRSGGTVLVEGTGRLLQDWYERLPPGGTRKMRDLRARFLAEHPFLRRLSGREPVAADPEDLLEPYVDETGTRLCVTEVSGRAGDVVVIHSNLLHATPVHTGTRPRFLAVRPLAAGGEGGAQAED